MEESKTLYLRNMQTPNVSKINYDEVDRGKTVVTT